MQALDHTQDKAAEGGGERAISSWRRAQGAAMVLVWTDGSLDFTGRGERITLAELPALPAAGRVRAVVTASEGGAYELLLRAELGGLGDLSALGVRIGHEGLANIHLHSRGRELPLPIATASLPRDFRWRWQEHLVEAQLGSDSLSIAIDGEELLELPHLDLALAKALLRAGVRPSLYPLPRARGFGLRAIGNCQLRLRRMSVTT